MEEKKNVSVVSEVGGHDVVASRRAAHDEVIVAAVAAGALQGLEIDVAEIRFHLGMGDWR